MPKRPRALVAWSSGKDSAYALWVAKEAGEFEIVGLLTTITANFGRVSMHAVRDSLLDRQARELGLPCHKVSIPWPCPDGAYERAMAEAMTAAKARGVETILFGDLFLADVRAYREAKLEAVGMHAVFPLWGRNTTLLARELLAAGVRATATCIDPRRLDASFVGRVFDERFLAELPDGVDPCGENGEFHTFVTDGPMFEHSIAVQPGEVVERDGFVFADLDLA